MSDQAKQRSRLTSLRSSGTRGPEIHERREQILRAAGEHFSHYGYRRTTIADIAKSIGLSTAYVYKFFDSKQAIGEAICGACMGTILDEVRRVAEQDGPAAGRMRAIYRTIADQGSRLFFNERKLHDLAVTASEEHWPTIRAYQAGLHRVVEDLIVEGRKTGEFEQETAITETSRAVLQTMELFSQPMFLERNFDELEEKTTLMAGLVLRSLAP